MNVDMVVNERTVSSRDCRVPGIQMCHIDSWTQCIVLQHEESLQTVLVLTCLLPAVMSTLVTTKAMTGLSNTALQQASCRRQGHANHTKHILDVTKLLGAARLLVALLPRGKYLCRSLSVRTKKPYRTSCTCIGPR